MCFNVKEKSSRANKGSVGKGTFENKEKSSNKLKLSVTFLVLLLKKQRILIENIKGEFVVALCYALKVFNVMDNIMSIALMWKFTNTLCLI